MTLILNLPADVESRLKGEARTRGIAPEEYAVKLLGDHLPNPEAPVDRNSLKRLFEQWAAEDRTDDPEEIARREKDWEEFAKGLDRNRVESGGPDVRRLFPWLEL